MKIALPYENCRKQFPKETKEAVHTLRISRSQSNTVPIDEVLWAVVLRERVEDKFLGGRNSRTLEGHLTARHKGWFTQVPLNEIPEHLREQWAENS